MAKRKKEDFNYSELSVDELTRRLDETRQDLLKLRFRSATAPLKNPLEIQHHRREVARLKTFINQRRSNG